MILQLNPPIPVLTPLGSAEAVGWIQEGKDLIWVVFTDDSGQCHQFPNIQIRAFPNYTSERMIGATSEAALIRLKELATDS